MMDDAEFQRGDIDIQWLERRLPEILKREPGDDKVRIAAIAAALIADRERVTPSSNAALQQSTNGANGADDAWRRAALLEGLRS
jgi:acetyl-CoA carboxylase biotin carboxylase subunit